MNLNRKRSQQFSKLCASADFPMTRDVGDDGDVGD